MDVEPPPPSTTPITSAPNVPTPPTLTLEDSWSITRTTYELSSTVTTNFYVIRFPNDPKGIIPAALRTHGKKLYLTEHGQCLKLIFASHVNVPIAPTAGAAPEPGVFAAINDYLCLTATRVSPASHPHNVSWDRVPFSFASADGLPSLQDGTTSLLYVAPSSATIITEVTYHPPLVVENNTNVSWLGKVGTFQVCSFPQPLFSHPSLFFCFVVVVLEFRIFFIPRFIQLHHCFDSYALSIVSFPSF